ncbi:hypothetical protein GALMADRAFT_604150 [Galerina marginata CBS 339.88]|uniref:Uncharacterized protein n=1 Tax=Galerina marginata (strain CBS 339.88) TaxID=685588 RepID=A0A067T2F6_GALM3|nr:hypothetical protein GALMADRAFT_604150 [Galerina marginata CBS 339.88]
MLHPRGSQTRCDNGMHASRYYSLKGATQVQGVRSSSTAPDQTPSRCNEGSYPSLRRLSLLQET